MRYFGHFAVFAGARNTIGAESSDCDDALFRGELLGCGWVIEEEEGSDKGTGDGCDAFDNE